MCSLKDYLLLMCQADSHVWSNKIFKPINCFLDPALITFHTTIIKEKSNDLMWSHTTHLSAGYEARFEEDPDLCTSIFAWLNGY